MNPNPYSTTGLPVIPYTLKTEIDGIVYETHVLTNTCQVITEDGITLCEVLKGLVTSKELQEAISKVTFEDTVYRYKGVLLNKPDISAIDQLYAKVGMQDGEVYLVELSSAKKITTRAAVKLAAKRAASEKSDPVASPRFDMYCWSSELNKWVFFGSTEKDTLPEGFPTDTLMEFPTKLGKPGQTITVSADGKTLEWKYANASTENAIKAHNEDENSHPAIWRELQNKADKLSIFNTVINKSLWGWSADDGCYTYVFSHENLPAHTYFELTPIAITKAELDVLKEASIHPVYQITDSPDGSYAVLCADRVPTEDINVCVKAFGDYIDK